MSTANPTISLLSGELQFVCGARHVEDLVVVPDTEFLIGGGAIGPGSPSGSLYCFDMKRRTAERLTPDTSRPPWSEYSAGPANLDLSVFDPHGVAIRSEAGQASLLYVVNHGGRESIEIFQLDVETGPGPLRLTWIGGLVFPDGVSGNAVTPLLDGGLAATKFFDTRKSSFPEQVIGREKTGWVYRWHPRKGFDVIPGTEGSGNNGVDTTADGKWLFVNLWAEQKILRVDLDGIEDPVTVPIDFMPDNIHRMADGKFLIAGHISTPEILFAGKREHCPVDWAVAILDPRNMGIEYILWEKGNPTFSDATGAVQVGDQIWISTYRGDRIAIADLALSNIGEPTE